MDIDEWWSGLEPSAQEWLIENSGEPVSPEILAEINEAGGVASPDAPWVGEVGVNGVMLSDAALDWVEAVANGETPDPL